MRPLSSVHCTCRAACTSGLGVALVRRRGSEDGGGRFGVARGPLDVLGPVGDDPPSACLWWIAVTTDSGVPVPLVPLTAARRDEGMTELEPGLPFT